MSHIPSKAMRHAAAPTPEPRPRPAPRTPAAAPLRPAEWATLGGIAALAGLGVAGLGTALADRIARKD